MANLILQSVTHSLPSSFPLTLARDVEWSYREAHAASFNNPLLDECDAEYNYPHYRRSIMEKRVRDSAQAAGLSVSLQWNHANNYQFTEIEAGDWIFTLKHTSDEKHMLKSSIFREQSAELNGLLPQLVMPTILGIKPAAVKRRFSAIIFHATDREDKSIPGFIRIGVPREDFSWWEACFDIHELIIGDTVAPSQEEIKAVATWKKRAARNSNQ
jgi:hypothetical protein